MYRRYYSYNDMPAVANRPVAEIKDNKQLSEKKREACESKNPLFENGKFLGTFETDDIILLAVVLMLLADDCDDKLLLLALAVVFLNF